MRSLRPSLAPKTIGILCKACGEIQHELLHTVDFSIHVGDLIGTLTFLPLLYKKD